MSDDTWKLIENCWKPEISERPKMEQVVLSIRSPNTLPPSVDTAPRSVKIQPLCSPDTKAPRAVNTQVPPSVNAVPRSVNTRPLRSLDTKAPRAVNIQAPPSASAVPRSVNTQPPRSLDTKAPPSVNTTDRKSVV